MTSVPPILAALLTPALFYAGAAGVGVPILIHILMRMRFRRVRWAAVEFLLAAERRNRRRVRLEEWLLMALRCLAVLLVGLLLARPFIRPAGLAAALGGPERAERVFVIDDSFSMGYKTGEGTVFDRAKASVRRLIEIIRTESPDDSVTILKMSDIANPVEFGTYLDAAQAEQVLARLEALTPSQRAIEPAAVVGGTAEVLRRGGNILNAVVYVVSDFQRADWVDQGDGPGGPSSTNDGPGGPSHTGPSHTGILAPLATWAAGDRGLKLFLVHVGVDDAANACVSEVTLGSTRLVAGTSGKVRAKVTNHADKAAPAMELSITVGTAAEGAKSLGEIAPRQTAEAEMDVAFSRAGDESVRVSIPPDALPIDDARQMAVEVSNAIRVLIVNGEPSADDYDDEVALLATALRPEGEVFSGNETVITDGTDLEERELAEFHAILLVNVYRLSEPVVESLERFVREGGGLIVFLGDQVDPEWYNASMYRGGQGVLPAELVEVRRPATEVHLSVADRLHPVMRGLSREGDPLGLGGIPFFAYYAVRPPGSNEESGGVEGAAGAKSAKGAKGAKGAKSEAGAGSFLAAQAAGSVHVAAVFDDADRSPAIVERAAGRAGRVVLFTTSADREWNRWPEHPTYLPVMIELVQHVARRASSETEHLVGSPIELRVDPAAYLPDAVVRAPGYPTEREVGLAARPADDGRGLSFVWDQTEQSGPYRFVLTRRDGGEAIRTVAVNVDPRESDLTTSSEDELRHALPDHPFEFIRGATELDAGEGEARKELWRTILVTAVVVLMMEQGLAWLWGRRK